MTGIRTPRPLVSVALPFHNAADTLREAVESIQRQTLTDWELLLFDDGSTDSSPETASSMASRDGRLRLVRSDHVGIVEGLRRACGEVRGRYVARMDADDVSMPDRLACQVALMESDVTLGLTGTGVAMTGERIGPGRQRYENWINRLVRHEDIVREVFIECPIAHPTFMVRRETHDAVGGYEDHGWPEDYDLVMRLFLHGVRFGKVDAPLLQWREHGGRLSMNDERYSPARFRALKRHYLRLSHLPPGRTFHQWGAGRVGKQWLREWNVSRPCAVVDINPRKVGRTIHGAPVIAPGELPQPGDTYIVIAVGVPGARDTIRGWLDTHGYREERDYLFLA